MAFGRLFQYMSSTIGGALSGFNFHNYTLNSASVLNNVTSTAMEMLSFNTLNNGTDDDDSTDSSIDFSSKSTIIGISCIAASMVAITAFFCFKYGRGQQGSSITFPVIIRNNRATSGGDSIDIPQLNISRLLTDIDRQTITQIGLMPFLKGKVGSIVEEKNEAGEDTQASAAIEQVAEVFFSKKDLTENLNPHDLVISIDIKRPKNKNCKFFERILPPMIRATMFFEISFALVQDIGALQLSEGMLPFSEKVNNDIAITQVVLSGIFMLLVMYAGPGQAFMGDMGASIDKFFHNKCKRKKEKSSEEKSSELVAMKKNAIPTSLKLKIGLSQGLLVILLLNNLFTQVIGDYQQTMSLNDKINSQPDSMLPAWLVFTCSMIEFGLNQLNDPINLISTIYMGCKLIDIYFRGKHKSEQHAISSIKIDTENDMANLLLPPAEPSPLRMLGKFSPKQQSLSKFSPDTDAPLPVGSFDEELGLGPLTSSLSYKKL